MMVAVLLHEGSHVAQTGANFIEAEDIRLTFEGAGQWTAYQRLIHPRGAVQPPEEALARFQKGPWSQTEGFAVVMALDRIAGPRWKRHVFCDGTRTLARDVGPRSSRRR